MVNFFQLENNNFPGITFTNCADTVTATGGGAMFATIGTTLNITACKFIGNIGRKGGALAVSTNVSNVASTLIIHDSVFDSNLASVSSGGALFTSMINADIRNTNFTNNSGNYYFQVEKIFIFSFY
jgi:hypothetical protein